MTVRQRHSHQADPAAGLKIGAAKMTGKRTPTAVDLLEQFCEQMPFLYGFVERMGVAAADRDDIIQEVFLVFHRRRKDFDDQRALLPWLTGIAYRLTLDLRRRGRELPFENLDPADDTGCSPELALSRRESASIVMHALQKVPPKQRAVFILHELQGQPVEDVARALKVPRFTVYSRLREGRRAFAVAAGRLLGKDSGYGV